jgi:two-component system KDP operon response regulator KdpE
MVELLARNPGKLIAARQLLEGMWGPGFDGETNSVRVQMAHIRRKLEPQPSQPRYILTEPGMGYRFVAEPFERR